MNKQNRKSRRVVWFACASLTWFSAGQFSRAADISWIGAAAPSGFGTPANWGGGAVPDAPDNAMINNGGIATVATGFTRTVTDLRLGAAPVSSGSLVQTGGTLSATGNMAFGSNA